MSLTEFDAGEMGRAERAFWEAFERLKKGKPTRLPKGSKVSQNNVAREAGVDPSALRRSRFPKLVAAIQTWIEEHQGTDSSPRQTILSQRAVNRSLRERCDALVVQRDDALGRLVDAEARILELTTEVEHLKARLPKSNVVPMRPAEKGKARPKSTTT